MLTLKEIQELTINPGVAREAHEQTSQLLADVLETRASFEQKAFAFFGGYITVSIALFGSSAAPLVSAGLARALLVAGLFLAVGASMFVMALRTHDYGSRGSAPSIWLTKDVLGGGEKSLYHVLAYLTFYRHDRIRVSIASNDEKAQFINRGIWLGLLAPVAFALALHWDRLNAFLSL